MTTGDTIRHVPMGYPSVHCLTLSSSTFLLAKLSDCDAFKVIYICQCKTCLCLMSERFYSDKALQWHV